MSITSFQRLGALDRDCRCQSYRALSRGSGLVFNTSPNVGSWVPSPRVGNGDGVLVDIETGVESFARLFRG